MAKFAREKMNAFRDLRERGKASNVVSREIVKKIRIDVLIFDNDGLRTLVLQIVSKVNRIVPSQNPVT
ncbi:MAG: hypothetical protein IPJ21_03125 [Sterolibacteriaceae bacterium]|nr:hypothetical protein [Sterolibacteriaceae bacterium]MBK9086649.1 hypothetical protein [Sterolibacteriaceae bacterium]